MVTKRITLKNSRCFLKNLKNGQNKCPKTEIPRPTLGYFYHYAKKKTRGRALRRNLRRPLVYNKLLRYIITILVTNTFGAFTKLKARHLFNKN
jgi:hypothetical protein